MFGERLVRRGQALPRSLLAGCVLAAAVTATASAEKAAGDPAAQESEIGVYLHAMDHPALGPPFTKRIKARVHRMLWTLLGNDVELTPLALPQLDEWLREKGIGDLDEELCRKFGCDRAQKALLLDVHCLGDTYYLSAAEYDRHFDSLSRARRVDVLQREMVPDSLGRLAMRCYSAVGIVLGVRGDRYILRFRNQDHLSSVAQWSRLKQGAPLQLYREILHSEGIIQQTRDGQYLVIDGVTPQEVSATLALSEAHQVWFQHLGDPRATYLVRLVDTEPTPVNIQVVLKETGQPRQGCEVFAASRRPQSTEDWGERCGVTDYDGRVRFETKEQGVLYVTVLYGGMFVTKPFVSGPTSRTLTFIVPPLSPTTDLEARLTALSDELNDKAIRVNNINRQIEEASAAGDADKIDQLRKQAEQLGDLWLLRKELRRLHLLAEGRGVVLTESFKRVEEQLSRFQSEFNKNGYDQSVRAARLTKLQEDIKAAWDIANWIEVERLYQQYLLIDPDNEDVKSQLDGLRKALRPKNSEHANAQKVVREAASIAAVDDLLARWDAIAQGLENLVANKDELALGAVAGEFNAWMKLVDDEAKRVQELLNGSQVLDPAEASRLNQRVEALKKIAVELPDIARKIDFLLNPS